VKQTRAGDLAMLTGSGRKEFIFRLDPAAELQTHQGVLKHEDLIGIAWGSQVASHIGKSFFILQPTLRDLLLHMRRQSQIVFPKDIGYILLRLSLGDSMRVIEAGTGSGAMTTALAWAVGREGRVFSYDRRADMIELAQRNLARVGLESRVVFRHRDIQDGFEDSEVDALFLDLPNPQDYLKQVGAALRSGGAFAAILPTTNQVSALLRTMADLPFGLTQVCETSLRFYKRVPERLRPEDRMVAHTGYLVFGRSLADVERNADSAEGEADSTEG
jgi:tRNA (adenine57-N1/adenine58-N1)-methyltransferase